MRHSPMFSAVFTLLALIAIPSVAAAGRTGPAEIEMVVGMGGPIGLIGASYPNGISTAYGTDIVAGRIGFPAYSPMRLELSMVIPSGAGANLLLDLVKVGNVRVHLIDPGVFWNVIEPVSVSRLPRKVDLTFGAGVDVMLASNWSLGLDWRWFLPNPVTVLPDYKDFAIPVYNEALRGGQLWANISYKF